jgi:predicted GH43/DUF377 family glycosyl hydrolase
MRWEKRGRIYVADRDSWWAHWYAFPPIPHLRPDGVLRIYVAFCDQTVVGRVGFVDVEPDRPDRILGVSREPVLDIGSDGAFDENGVLPLSVVPVGDLLYMYYTGFQLGQKVRYFQYAGLASSSDGGDTFQRVRRVPILERSDAELLNRTSTFVVRVEDRFRMWYAGGSAWTDVGGKQLPVYNLRYLESADGIHWPDEGRICIDFANADEHAFGRPWVIQDDSLYRMFYSVRTRSQGYRIGYAESIDGIEWVRKDDEVGIDVSPEGWDSESIAYASVFRHQGVTTLFYNGNQLGRTGFGYATLAAP